VARTVGQTHGEDPPVSERQVLVVLRKKRHGDAHMRFDGHECRPVDAPERVSDVVDAGWIQVRPRIAIDVGAHLDLPNQLHEVGDSLTEPIRIVDQSPRSDRPNALSRIDQTVSVLVEAVFSITAVTLWVVKTLATAI
jgi:hypothetical protein